MSALSGILPLASPAALEQQMLVVCLTAFGALQGSLMCLLQSCLYLHGIQSLSSLRCINIAKEDLEQRALVL